LRSAGALASSPVRGRGASRRRPIEQSVEGTKGLFVFFLLFRVFSVFCGQLSNFWMALVFSLLLSNIFRSLQKKKKVKLKHSWSVSIGKKIIAWSEGLENNCEGGSIDHLLAERK
jgi:hypothetical protein